MRDAARRLALAVAFLTRLPVPTAWLGEPGATWRALPWFPLVGALLGVLLAVAARLLAPALPPPLAASLLLLLLALLTGALHLDGLADTADGLLGGRTREEALRIMRDHAVGAYGASALALVLLVEASALSALLLRPWPELAAWLGVALALSRWAAVPLACLLPPARADGLGAGAAGRAGGPTLAAATALALLGAAALGWRGLAALAAVTLLAALLGATFRRRLGGVTGDTLGATVLLSEALALVVAVALPLP